MSNRTRIADGTRICPTCDRERERLSRHWSSALCSTPTVSDRQHELITGLLLGNGSVQGNGENKHFQISTRWRPFADWIFNELDWLSHSIVRIDPDRMDHGHRYVVRTHAHSALTRYRSCYDGDGKHLPSPESIPFSSRVGRAWWATAGGLQWHGEYATQRTGTISAEADDRAQRVVALFEAVGLEPTRAGARVQLPPKQVTGWLDWIDDPVPGIEYKWAATEDEYRDYKRDAEALHARLHSHPDEESSGKRNIQNTSEK